MLFRNKNRDKTRTEAAAAHRQNLIKNLEHRLEVARSQGNEKLLRQLEAEARYLHIK